MPSGTNSKVICPKCGVERAELQTGQWCTTCGYNPKYETAQRQSEAALRVAREALDWFSYSAGYAEKLWAQQHENRQLSDDAEICIDMRYLRRAAQALTKINSILDDGEKGG